MAKLRAFLKAQPVLCISFLAAAVTTLLFELYTVTLSSEVTGFRVI